uniref:S-layer homology domain-containing protein n=1 Tax=Trichocoleus desertorum TaxID=1481672 RepID=UPI0025B2B82C|nr:S-layer homology domain-containing protein [Trichocoleus desertorum]
MNQGVLASLGKLFLAATILSMTAFAPANALSSTSVADATNSPVSSQQLSTEQSGELIISQSDDDSDDDGDDDSDSDDDSDDDDGGDDDSDDDDGEEVELSSGISRTVLQQVSQSQNLSLSSLRIVRAERVEWSNGCLGLGGPGVACTQAIVPGYRVFVEGDNKTWVFRTNATGSQVVYDEAATQQIVRRTTSSTATSGSSQTTGSTSGSTVRRTTETETRQTTTTSQSSSSQVRFTQAIATSVYQAITTRSQVQASQLRVVSVQQETWSDSCLGVPGTASTCTAGDIPGFRVVVASTDEVWVYRTNATGSVVAFDETATQTLMARMTSQSTTSQSTTSTGQQTTTSSTQVNFTDVSRSYWAYEFISRLAQQNIVEGFPDNTFRPSEAVTKAQFAAVLRKAFNQTTVREAIDFRDVSSGYWAYSAIREAYTMGFFGADSDRLFNPTARLTRLDVLVALARGLNYTSVTSTTSVDTILQGYSDAATIPADVRTLIAALAQRGIVVNYPNTNRLELSRVATRAEVCSFLYQALVSTGRAQSFSSPYVIQQTGTVEADDDNDDGDDDGDDDDQSTERRQNCNQGIGNGAEGCDPGNSSPRGGSNDEGGRTPGQPPAR